MRVSDAGHELIFANGKAVGHRQYVTYYRQRSKQTDSRDSIRIAKMVAEYRALGCHLFHFTCLSFFDFPLLTQSPFHVISLFFTHFLYHYFLIHLSHSLHPSHSFSLLPSKGYSVPRDEHQFVDKKIQREASKKYMQLGIKYNDMFVTRPQVMY